MRNTELNKKILQQQKSPQNDMMESDINNGGLEKIFMEHQIQSEQRQKKQSENAHLLKDIMLKKD